MELVTPARTYYITTEDSDTIDSWIEAINALTGQKLHSLADSSDAQHETSISSDTPLGKMIESTLKACKEFYPYLSRFVELANKYQSKMASVTDTGKSLADLMYHLGANGGVETGTGKELCKIATAVKEIEQRKNELVCFPSLCLLAI